jgi:uncharacterized membrane protein YeaQ/YmgE (transglycosylase-associated protein family)
MGAYYVRICLVSDHRTNCWLAGKIMKGGGFGLIGDLVIGVIGALVGEILFGLLGLSASGFMGSLITAVVGAIVLLFIVGWIKKRK